MRTATCWTLAGAVLFVAALAWRLGPEIARVYPQPYNGEIRIEAHCVPCCSYYWWQGRWWPSCGQVFRVERDTSGRLVSVPADRWPELAAVRAW